MLAGPLLEKIGRLAEEVRRAWYILLTSRASDAQPQVPPPLPQDEEVLQLVRDDNVAQMADYLRRGGDPNALCLGMIRPLFLASSEAMADLLLGAGADPSLIDDFGRNVAHAMAIMDRRLPALQRVVQAGAELGRVENHFETPLDVARREGATAAAAWLESIAAPEGALARYRREHPFPRLDRAERRERRAKQMPSLAQPVADRHALWQHLRDLIEFWDPRIDWRLLPAPPTEAALNSRAGVELPAAMVEFYQSGIFDWILWKADQSDPPSMRCSWATAEVIGQRHLDELLPVMQHMDSDRYCIERDELRNDDPAVRFADCRRLLELDPPRLPQYTIHTGCRFSEFVANLVYRELADATPAHRYVDLDTSYRQQAAHIRAGAPRVVLGTEAGGHSQEIHIRQQFARCALPLLRSGDRKARFVAIFEGPNAIFVEIEEPALSQAYYGILGGESDAALGQLLGEDLCDDDAEAPGANRW